MKKSKSIVIIGVLAMAIFTACQKTDIQPVDSIVGTYEGTYSAGNGLKYNVDINADGINATAVVVDAGSGQIQIHCFSSELDTTFMLNYYLNNDSINVCLTGNAFNSMYGHMLGSGHMSGGMMGDIQNGETEWMHHMNDEHTSGDEHFGGFDTPQHSFGFTFKMIDSDYHFQGTKN